MRILVADISGRDKVRPPVAEFLGIKPWDPPPEMVVWRGHEVIVKAGIGVGDAERLKPDMVFALMGWHGVGAARSRFYEHFFSRGVPVFTWGNDSNIPRLMARVEKGRPESRRVVFVKPDHPILAGLKPSDIRTSGRDWRTLVKEVRGDIGLAADPDNKTWEIIYLEERGRRWLHYHPYPAPPPRLIDNYISIVLRTMEREKIIQALAGLAASAAAVGIAIYLAKR